SCPQLGCPADFRKSAYAPGGCRQSRMRPAEMGGQSFMLRVTCDLCGKDLSPGEDQRYVVKMEVFAAHDPVKITEADLDDDHLEAVSELLHDIEEGSLDPELSQPAFRHFRYDLCPDCHKKFVRDPLSKDAAQKFDFSEN